MNTGTPTVPTFEKDDGNAQPLDGFSVGGGSAVEFADVDGDGLLDAQVRYFGAGSGTFICDNGEEIPGNRVNDGAEDCKADGSDEGVHQGPPSPPLTLTNMGTADEPEFANVNGGTFSIAEALYAPDAAEEDVFPTSTSAFVAVSPDGDNSLGLVIGEGDSLIQYDPAATGGTVSDSPLSSLPYQVTADAAITNGGGDPAPGLVDLDADGDLDMPVGLSDGTILYFLNDPQRRRRRLSDFVLQQYASNPFAGIDVGNNAKLAFADLDGDGDYDLLAGNSAGRVFFFENTGRPTIPVFTPRGGTEVLADGAAIDVGANSAPALADFDYDGDLDLVCGNADGSLLYYENVGDASDFSLEERTGSAANPFDGYMAKGGSQPSVADLDGDGDMDVLVGTGEGWVVKLTNNWEFASPPPPVALGDDAAQTYLLDDSDTTPYQAALTADDVGNNIGWIIPTGLLLTFLGFLAWYIICMRKKKPKAVKVKEQMWI